MRRERRRVGGRGRERGKRTRTRERWIIRGDKGKCEKVKKKDRERWR